MQVIPIIFLLLESIGKEKMLPEFTRNDTVKNQKNLLSVCNFFVFQIIL